MTTVLDNIRRQLNHGTDQEREQYLAHPEPAIRALAIKSHTSPSVEQLIQASQDEDPCVREAVVELTLITNKSISADSWDQVLLSAIPQHGHIKILFEEGRLSFNGVWNGIECLRQHGFMIGFQDETLKGLFACLDKDNICKLFQQGRIDLDSFMFYDNQEEEDYTMGEYLMEYHPSEYELLTASILESKLRTTHEGMDVSLNTNSRPRL